MSWSNLIGQSAAKGYLRAVLSTGRLAHAYLFAGPAGVGKRTAAHAFAQVVLCHKRPAPDEACGECKSCRWFLHRRGADLEHPDVIVPLVRKTRRESDGRESHEDRLVGDHEQVIKLESIQLVCEQLHRSPMAGEKRVAIIAEAQRFCRGQAEAANAFLKTLEEPPRSSLILLTSSQPEGLLETIISRLQTVQLRRLTSAEVLEGVRRRRPDFDPQQMILAGMSGGSIGRALELLDGDVKRWRETVVNGLGGFGAGTYVPFAMGLWDFAEGEGERLFEAEKQKEKAEDSDEEGTDEESADEKKTSAGWKRHVFTRMLGLCEICFRDGLVCAAAEGAAVELLQPDLPQLAQVLARKFGADGCEKALGALREAQMATRLYVRGDVTARALAGRLRAALT